MKSLRRFTNGYNCLILVFCQNQNPPEEISACDSGLSRTEAGIHSAESVCGAGDCATRGREAVKSVLRLFDELVKCDEEGILKNVRKAAEDVSPT